MSASTRRPLTRAGRNEMSQPPPKKSRTGLIILIVVIIVIILAVGITVGIILWRRSQTSSSGGTPVTKCVTSGDCPSGKVCNTSSGICVTCLTDANCSGSTPACVNNSCLECATNSHCTDPLEPICSNNQCVDCLVDADCSGSPHYSGLGHNLCSNKTCVECKIDGDCGGSSTCVGNACCDLTSPSITASTATIGVTDSISTTFTYVQTPADVKYKLLVAGRLSGGTGSASGTTLTVTLFDATQFNIAVGQYVAGGAFVKPAKIVALGTGTGSTGTYTLDTPITAASGNLEFFWGLYTSPAALTSASSPQNVSINDTEFGRRLEPSAYYYSMIELTVTCGTTQNTVRSLPFPAFSGSFNTGDDAAPLPQQGGYPQITGSNPNFNFAAWLGNGNPLCQSGFYGSVTRWTGLSPALFGVVPGSSAITTATWNTPALYSVTLDTPFNLNITSGVTVYNYYKIWGGNGANSGPGTCFHDWRYMAAANIP